MIFSSAEGERRYQAMLDRAARTVVGLDFDGTLAPIVDDPSLAHIHPEAGRMLVELAEEVAAIAVITGRPARQVLDLGGLEEVGDAISAVGKPFFVFGQYGNERWTADQRRIQAPRPPRGLASFELELPRTLRDAAVPDAFVEDKGLAVAVHTRRVEDPVGAFERLLSPLSDLAQRHGLIVEPGRNVIEVRSAGAHKGLVVEGLAAELGAEGFLFAGDDLGDVEAFEAVDALEARGLAALRVCSASREESALIALSDVVVRGPQGVIDLLRTFAHDARAVRAQA